MSKLGTMLEQAGAILLALIWISPLLFAFWAAFHTSSDAVSFNLLSAWTLDNFRTAWEGAPWLRYFLNTFLLVTIVLIGQFFFTTLAGFAFAKMDFPDESFRLVVFDPPHIEQDGDSQITKRYGALRGDWREMLRRGFAECFRVLKPEGVLIFKWSDCRFPVRDILALTPEKPMFGHRSGKKMGTHWIAFMKPNV